MRYTTNETTDDRMLTSYDVHGNIINTEQQRCSTNTIAIPSVDREVGAGNCGSVWTQGNATWVIKKADGSIFRNLWKEYYLQNRALFHLNKYTANIHIPASFWYVSRDGCTMMCSESIPPLSKTFKDLLVDRFCPGTEEVRQQVKDKDVDCIARIYLGRTRLGDSRFFKLRNIPLKLDQLKELGLPVHDYAQSIAEALSFLHWAAEMDGNDVEFVLGSCRQLVDHSKRLSPSVIAALPYDCDAYSSDRSCPTQQLEPRNLGTKLQVWLLDFDCCDSITMDDEGVEKAAFSALMNDPYHSRPCLSGEPNFELWKTFSDHYLETGARILESRGLDKTRPAKFIERLAQLTNLRELAKTNKEMESICKFYPRGKYCEPHSDDNNH